MGLQGGTKQGPRGLNVPRSPNDQCHFGCHTLQGVILIQGVSAAPDRPRCAGPQHGEPAAVAAHAHTHARDRRRDAAAASHVGADVAANQVINTLKSLVIIVEK